MFKLAALLLKLAKNRGRMTPLRLFTVLVTLIVSLLLASCALSNNPTINTTSPPFILNNVNIIDVAKRSIIPHQRLLIREGRIEEITSAQEPLHSTKIKVIEGHGGYVTPGLIDMHVHMYEEAAFALSLSHGVTHVRILNGIPAHLKWREKLENGEMTGSTITVSSPIISGFQNASLHHTIHSPKEALNAVHLYKKQGYDLLKVYGNLKPEVLTALIQESQREGMPIAKHGPHASGKMPVSTLTGAQSFEHVEDIYQGPLNYAFSHDKLPPVIADLKATGVPITPTLNIFEQLTRISAEKADFVDTIPQEYTSNIIKLEATHNQVKRWLNASEKSAAHNQKTLAFLLDITNRLHQDDIELLVGSDSGVLLSPHGLATHNEIRLLQDAGLDAFNVLQAATLNPAKALTLHQKIGQIQKQFQADFIYTYANPISDLSVLKNPEAVIKKGAWYNKKQLLEMRRTAIKERSFWQELRVLFEAL